MDQKEVMQIIADAIVDSATKDWLKASLEILVLGHSVDTELCFEYEDNPMGWEFIVNHGEISNAVMNYHKLLHETGNAKWNKMHVLLYPTGKFEVEFQWDQDIQDEFERDSRI